MNYKNQNRRLKRKSSHRKSKFSTFMEAAIIEGIAVAVMLVFFLGVSADIRHHQRIKLRWEAMREGQSLELKDRDHLFGQVAEAGIHTSTPTWKKWTTRFSLP